MPLKRRFTGQPETLQTEKQRGRYLSLDNLRGVLRIGKAAKVDEFDIHWSASSNQIHKFTELPIEHLHTHCRT
jgi:hypothetical protein